MPQGRLSWRFRQRGAVPRGWLRMPAMPVAQIPGTSQADLARMALLAVELAGKADARQVLKRQNARTRAETRRADPDGLPMLGENARTRGFFGASGRFSEAWRGRKRLTGLVLLGDKRLMADGRSRLIDHS